MRARASNLLLTRYLLFFRVPIQELIRFISMVRVLAWMRRSTLRTALASWIDAGSRSPSNPHLASDSSRVSSLGSSFRLDSGDHESEQDTVHHHDPPLQLTCERRTAPLLAAKPACDPLSGASPASCTEAPRSTRSPEYVRELASRVIDRIHARGQLRAPLRAWDCAARGAARRGAAANALAHRAGIRSTAAALGALAERRLRGAAVRREQIKGLRRGARRAFCAWRDGAPAAARELARQQGIVRRTLQRMRAADGAASTLHAWRHAAHAAKHRLAAAQRRRGRLLAWAAAEWRAAAHAAAAAARLVRRALGRLLGRSAAAAFDAWRLSAGERRRQRDLMRRASQRIFSRGLAASWAAWVDAAAAARRARRAAAWARRRGARRAAAALGGWRAAAEGGSARRGALHRALRQVRRAALQGAVLDAWHAAADLAAATTSQPSGLRELVVAWLSASAGSGDDDDGDGWPSPTPCSSAATDVSGSVTAYDERACWPTLPGADCRAAADADATADAVLRGRRRAWRRVLLREEERAAVGMPASTALAAWCAAAASGTALRSAAGGRRPPKEEQPTTLQENAEGEPLHDEGGKGREEDEDLHWQEQEANCSAPPPPLAMRLSKRLAAGLPKSLGLSPVVEVDAADLSPSPLPYASTVLLGDANSGSQNPEAAAADQPLHLASQCAAEVPNDSAAEVTSQLPAVCDAEVPSQLPTASAAIFPTVSAAAASASSAAVAAAARTASAAAAARAAAFAAMGRILRVTSAPPDSPHRSPRAKLPESDETEELVPVMLSAAAKKKLGKAAAPPSDADADEAIPLAQSPTQSPINSAAAVAAASGRFLRAASAPPDSPRREPVPTPRQEDKIAAPPPLWVGMPPAVLSAPRASPPLLWTQPMPAQYNELVLPRQPPVSRLAGALSPRFVSSSGNVNGSQCSHLQGAVPSVYYPSAQITSYAYFCPFCPPGTRVCSADGSDALYLSLQ
jgi:hypothetical protein